LSKSIEVSMKTTNKKRYIIEPIEEEDEEAALMNSLDKTNKTNTSLNSRNLIESSDMNEENIYLRVSIVN
jgi:hypothetical protein